MNKRLLISLFLIVMIVLVFTVVQNQKNNNISISENETPLSDGVDGSKTAIEFVHDMGAGWNLGNSFCCYDGKSYGEKTVAYYETLWGNPMTTKTTIHAIKAKGFKTVRIPITYRNHIDSNNQIDEKWLLRIKEVVDYVLQDDMYCIINLHHENWLIADTKKQASGQEKLEAVWNQIAEYFSDYGNKLIFEGFNEVINSAGQWDSADKASYDVVNKYNQTFVSTVRNTGGNNSSRYLIVNTYAAKATRSVLDGFVLPHDTIDDHLIVSTHIYDGIESAKGKFDNLFRYFIKHNIPVIVGEWGLINSSSNTEQKRIQYARDFLNYAYDYGIPCVWWDDGGIYASSSAVTNYAILQRKTGNWYFDGLATEIINSSQIKYVKDISVETIEDIFNMRDVSGWKSGDYNYSTGKYSANTSRLCLKEEQKLLANTTYTAIINDSNYHILVRLMNSSGKLIKSFNLANMDTFLVDSDDYTVRISIYNYANSNVCKSFEAYSELFKAGFEARIEADVAVGTDEISKDKQDETNVDNEEEIDNDNEVIDTDIFGMKNFSNWRSGNYSCNTGKYTNNSSRICLNDYVKVVPNQTYSVKISDSNYCVLVRLLDENNKMVRSLSVREGGTFTIKENEIKAGISLYNSKSGSMVFDDYQKLFEGDFYSYIEIKN